MKELKRRFRLYLVSRLNELSEGQIKETALSRDNTELTFAIRSDDEVMEITLIFEKHSGACRIACARALPPDVVMMISKIQEAVAAFYQKCPSEMSDEKMQKHEDT